MTPKLVLAIAVWSVAAAGGLYAVTAHGAAEGRPASAPATLGASLRSSGRATIVVAAHPSCPCTRATLHELRKVAEEANGAADIVILLAGHGTDRVADDIRANAASIPGARIVEDKDRAIAESLGAHTSGTVLFYDVTGALRFSGGITPSRGHEGASAGADAVRALVKDSAATTPRSTPIYGCPISDSKSPKS